MGYYITLIIGIMLLAFSLFVLNNSLALIQKNERTVATVIQREEVRDSDGTNYRPVFKFVTTTKKEIHFHHFATGMEHWRAGSNCI
ncbi:hypothetical protein BH11BAC3_BH11BAC3_47670 [soil metagenome]